MADDREQPWTPPSDPKTTDRDRSPTPRIDALLDRLWDAADDDPDETGCGQLEHGYIELES